MGRYGGVQSGGGEQKDPESEFQSVPKLYSATCLGLLVLPLAILLDLILHRSHREILSHWQVSATI